MKTIIGKEKTPWHPHMILAENEEYRKSTAVLQGGGGDMSQKENTDEVQNPGKHQNEKNSGRSVRIGREATRKKERVTLNLYETGGG